MARETARRRHTRARAAQGRRHDRLLEETLLHTFEPTSGGSVASPHTPADLDRIAELKERQGIDYDVHASYRFVEEGKAPSDSDA